MRHIYSTYKEHYKALIFLGLPIVIGQIGVIVLGFADTLMIGHHSTIELGAASFVNNVFNLAIIFSTGFGRFVWNPPVCPCGTGFTQQFAGKPDGCIAADCLYDCSLSKYRTSRTAGRIDSPD